MVPNNISVLILTFFFEPLLQLYQGILNQINEEAIEKKLITTKKKIET